ncbi:unnamed protein product [Ectocarpus fasciculatus]
MAAAKRTGTSTSTRLVLLLVATAAFSSLPPPVTAYSGTVPIFPDIAAGKSKAAAVAYETQCRTRQKVFAPRAVVRATDLTKNETSPGSTCGSSFPRGMWCGEYAMFNRS